MYDKVFISYAKEDYSFAEELYFFLEKNGFRSWLDKKSILPGQDWNFTLGKALREANYIILLLSKNSVQKRGYVQREFKLSLEYYEEKLDDDIYLIPLKINDCEVPERLSKFQWVEYSSENCFELVFNSLYLQREKYYEFDRKLIASKELFEYEEKNEKFEYGTKLKFEINVNYFEFVDDTNPNLKELNEIIRGKKTKNILNSRRYFHEVSGELIDISNERLNWSFDISYTPNIITKSIISINENYSSYTGGAHGNYFISGLNYHINPVFKINLEDLFEYDDKPKFLQFLSKYCFDELKKIYNEWMETPLEDIEKQKPEDIFYENSLNPEWKNFKNFIFSKNGLNIIFNSYSVSSYAFGVQIIPVPFEKIFQILNKPQLLESIIYKIQK